MPGVQRDDSAELPQIHGAYTLRVEKGQPQVQAHDAAGEFYANQTLQQLLIEHEGELPDNRELSEKEGKSSDNPEELARLITRITDKTIMKILDGWNDFLIFLG